MICLETIDEQLKEAGIIHTGSSLPASVPANDNPKAATFQRQDGTLVRIVYKEKPTDKELEVSKKVIDDYSEKMTCKYCLAHAPIHIIRCLTALTLQKSDSWDKLDEATRTEIQTFLNEQGKKVYDMLIG